jgi:crossover junction endodeoxyribonuclease RusA
MRELSFTIPYPHGISVNKVWKRSARGIYVDKDVLYYKMDVKSKCNTLEAFGKEKVCVSISMFPPDNRRRDVDNILKVTLDALTYAGLIEDDSQIMQLLVRKFDKVKAGKLDILIYTYE